MFTRRSFLSSSVAGSTALTASFGGQGTGKEPAQGRLSEFGYGDVELAPGPMQAQLEQTMGVLMSLNEDSLLKPWRMRAGLPAPGPELGGWYDELPLQKTESGGHGFAPGHCFGQWISALSRGYAIGRDQAVRTRLGRLLDLYGQAISTKFYTNFRFPAYNFDKMVIGLIDAHEFGAMPQAFTLLERTTDAAQPRLPPHALNRDEPQREWRRSMAESTANDYTWDESYTLPENLYLAAARGAGDRYRKLARRFLLDDTWFTPLAEGRNVLGHHHAYSFCNSLNSAMQAYVSDDSAKHLAAARNAFDMIERTQSFATGGWGPNESFVAEGSDDLYKSLTGTHRGFETPCGSYAHFKLTRSLLRVTRDGRYGDSMERVLYNTVLGAKPLTPDGEAFYYSDYSETGSKVYFPDRWPCCSGTLPQVTADYRLLVYLREAKGLLVNLYVPSTVRWTESGGAEVRLTQSGGYPLEERAEMVVRCSRPAEFTVSLRIPGWVSGNGAAIRVNGQPVAAKRQRGFATIERRWSDGDRIALGLPMPLRLEPLNREHPECVAVMRGPLVLFASGGGAGKVSAGELLRAERNGAEWRVKADMGSGALRPFASIGGERYQTYFHLAQV